MMTKENSNDPLATLPITFTSSPKLTPSDRKYIKYILTVLDKSSHSATLKDNHYKYLDPYANSYSGYGHKISKETQDCWDSMMQSFETELKNNTRKFTYTLPATGYTQKINRKVYQTEVSSWLIAQFLFLTTDERDLIMDCLYGALNDKRLDLILLILSQQKTTYATYRNIESLFNEMCNYIQKLISFYPDEIGTIEKAFTSHLMLSNLSFKEYPLNEDEAIKQYQRLFPNGEINTFLKNIDLEIIDDNLFFDVEKNNLATFCLNLKKLLTTSLTLYDIEELSVATINKKIDFQSIYIVENNRDSLMIGLVVDEFSHEDTIHLGKNLFQSLIHVSYSFSADKNYELLKNIMLKVKLELTSQPNELIDKKENNLKGVENSKYKI